MALTFLLLSLSVTRAFAEPRVRVAALISPANAAMTARIGAELAAGGFELQLAQPLSWPPSRQEIAEIARKERAIAGLALIPHDDVLEIWIVDRVTGKTVVRELPSEPDQQSAQDRADLVAICALETLRATLLELTVVHHSQGEVAPPPAVRALLRPEPSRFALRVGTGVGYSGDSLGPAVELGVAGSVALLPHLHLGLDAFVPLTAPTLTGPEGQAEVGASLMGAFTEVSLTDPSARADVMVGGGAWVALLTLRGRAQPSYLGTSVQVVTLVPHLDLGARARLGRRIAFIARVSGAVATPKANVRFAGRDVAAWGRPFVLGAMMIEVGLD
jgi:hypothetical protein